MAEQNVKKIKLLRLMELLREETDEQNPMKAKRILSAVLSLLILFSALPISASAQTLSDDIVILYTNDIHTYIDGPLSYDVVAGIKKDLEKQYKNVFLVDAGDHIQGTAYGSMDEGESIIKLMNAADYDVATLGNHEFDYNMSGCLNIIELADFPYVSANFHHEENGVCGENVLDSYVLFDCGSEKLAVIGVTTPETYTKSTPAYFQNEAGEFIYGISGGENGDELQNDVQEAIDEAEEQGATKIVAIGHLGTDPSSKPWTSEETIAGICGLDAFIDGHSHSVIEKKIVKDEDGCDVVLTQTGEYFSRIGMMVIDSETDEITTDFIECEEILAADGETVEGYNLVSELYSKTELICDAETQKIKNEWIAEIDKNLGKKIGTAAVTLDNYDADGNRLVRVQETNSGDFAADALYYLFDNMGFAVDAAIMNGGGIRNTAITGEFTYKTCKDMHTFGNVACLQKVTGQQILNALEWGSRSVGNGESGSFLHVSGITYKINTAMTSDISENDLEAWGGALKAYRVYDVKIYDRATDSYKDIELDKTYYLAGYNYTLRNFGDGFGMFESSENIQDYVMEDYMVLANYIQGFENSVVDATNSPLLEEYPGFKLNYSNINGSGRIEITDGANDAISRFEDVKKTDWFYNDVEYVVSNDLMNGTTEKNFAPKSKLTRAMLVAILYRAEGEPATNRSIPFADVEMGSWYANAVTWTQQNGIVNGTTETTFEPNSNITREQIAAILYRYAIYKGMDAVNLSENLGFADADDISSYAISAMNWAVGTGLIKGYENNTVRPLNNATRAEAATLLQRFLEADK